MPVRDLISVIVPTYNRAALIHETLASIFEQTYADYEVLVVDDGSDDGTYETLASYGDRIRYLRIQHAGASVARNAGMALARGDTVAFLDSDDRWTPTFLEKMTAALTAAPGAGFAYCDYAMFSRDGPVQPVCLAPDEKINGDIFPKLLEGAFVCTGSLLIRRSALQQIGGFDPGLRIVHDWDLWLRLAHRYDAVYVDEPLLRIRRHAENLSHDAVRIYVENLRVLGTLEARFPHTARRFRETMRKNEVACHRSLAAYYRGKRRPLPMLRHLARLLEASVR